MLRAAIIVVAWACLAFGGVVNVCGQQPYNQMQDFKDYEPAKADCAPHYPAQTLIKRLPHKCLTTTKTIIMRTSIVTATRTEECHHEHSHTSTGPHGYTHTTTTHKHQTTTTHKHHTTTTHKHHTTTTRKHTTTHKTSHRHSTRTTKHTHTTPESMNPVPITRRAELNAAATPAILAKRDASMDNKVKSAEWASYHANLVKCGYDCIQTACSCVAATKLEIRTPKPTCTSTCTKSTVVHETKTVVVPPKHCPTHGHEGHYGGGDEHHHENGPQHDHDKGSEHHWGKGEEHDQRKGSEHHQEKGEGHWDGKTSDHHHERPSEHHRG